MRCFYSVFLLYSRCMLLSAFLQPYRSLQTGPLPHVQTMVQRPTPYALQISPAYSLVCSFLIIRFQCRLTVSCHILWGHGTCDQLLRIRIETPEPTSAGSTQSKIEQLFICAADHSTLQTAEPAWTYRRSRSSLLLR